MYAINLMHLNHAETTTTTTPPPVRGKIFLRKRVLGAKNLETAVLWECKILTAG